MAGVTSTGLSPTRNRERQIDADTAHACGVDNRVTKAFAPLVSIVGATGEQLGPNLQQDVEADGVVGTPLMEAEFDIARAQVSVVGLFWALDNE